MNSLYAFTHPKLSNDFQRESAFFRDADPAVRAKASEPFIWLVNNKAEPLLYSALARFAPLVPIAGLDGKPELWRSPPPSGLGGHVGIVIGLNTNGELRCVGSNCMPVPGKPTSSAPPEFFKTYDALRTIADQVNHIHQTICAAASPHLVRVESVCAEGQRYRTLPIFLAILDGAKHHFYATTSLVEGPRQTNSKLLATGKVIK
jgi:hypothetical protein